MVRTTSGQRGGKREGAGRPKGAVGGRARSQIEEIAQLHPNWSPLRHFAQVANDESLPAEVRLDAAKAAAPYLYAKLKPIECDPEAALEYEERLAEIRATHSARILKEGLGVAGLAERMERVRAALDEEERAVAARPIIPVRPVPIAPPERTRG